MRRPTSKRINAALRDPGTLAALSLTSLALAVTLAAGLYCALFVSVAVGAASAAVALFAAAGAIGILIARMIEVGRADDTSDHRAGRP